MSEVVYFANPHRVDEQAAEWIARLDAGLTEPQKSELREWLSAHPSHPEALARMAELWDAMAMMEELSGSFPLPRSQSSLKRRNWPVPLAAASGVVALLVTAMIWFAGSVPDVTPDEGIALDRYVGHYETGIGEQSTAMLPDGSSVALNTNSAIDVLYSSTERRIVMSRGEALYQVVKDPARPFNVHADGHVVQAVGTAFDVHLKAKRVEVTVTKGVVKVWFAPMPAVDSNHSAGVEMPPEEVVLRVGDSAAFVPNQFSVDAIRKLDRHDMEMKLSWKDGMLAFENQPLSDVLDEVSRYTPIEIVASAAVRDVKVGGYFKAGDIDGLLVALKNNFDIDAERISGNKIVLRRE